MLLSLSLFFVHQCRYFRVPNFHAESFGSSSQFMFSMCIIQNCISFPSFPWFLPVDCIFQKMRIDTHIFYLHGLYTQKNKYNVAIFWKDFNTTYKNTLFKINIQYDEFKMSLKNNFKYFSQYTLQGTNASHMNWFQIC